MRLGRWETFIAEDGHPGTRLAEVTSEDIRQWLLENGADELRDVQGKHTGPGKVTIIWQFEEKP